MTISKRLGRLKWRRKPPGLRLVVADEHRQLTFRRRLEDTVKFLTRIGIIVGVVTLATLATAATDYYVGDATIYTFYMIAVIVIGFRYSTAYVLLAGIVSGLTYAYFFADPPDSFAIDRPEVTFGLIVLTVLAVLTGRIVRDWKRTNQNLRQTRDGLLRRTEELSRSLERELEAITVMRNFVATMCHEFRTPLTTIDVIAQNEIRAAKAREDSKSVVSHETMRAQVLRIGQLLTSLDKSVGLSGVDTPRRAVVVLNDLVAETCALQKLTTPSRSIAINGVWPETAILGDRDLLRQLFSNLLINAVKYSPPSAPIVVEGRVGDGFVDVSVIDEGIGIPSGERERVFEQFYRGSNTGAVEGTGLGLALCRDVARMHGGDIRIADNVPVGTRVTVRFPVKPGAAG
jgi:K+-sensing histidine kinase KdpD